MSNAEIDKILARQSLELLDAVQRNEPDAAEKLAKWIKQSRRHTEHYLMAVAFERELDQIEFDPHLDVGAGTAPANVVTLQHGCALPSGTQVPRPSATSSRRRTGWMAAAVAAGIALMTSLYWHAHRHEFTTAVGEQRAIELTDGSVVHLNTQSRIRVRFTAQSRDLELLAGEALFKVHRDASRPFRVHTSDAVIQAIGTQFNVYRRPEGTTIAVLEGRVKVIGDRQVSQRTAENPVRSGNQPLVHSARLDVGQQAHIDNSGQISTQHLEDVENVASWRQRRLIFSGTPLPQIVAEFNRYNRDPQLVLPDGNPSGLVYSGVFDADDPESLIQLLEREPSLQLQRYGNRVMIISSVTQ